MPLKIVNSTLLAFRFLLTTVGAAAMLYALSYPYSIVAPSPEWDFVDELTYEQILKGLQAMLATIVAPWSLVDSAFNIPVAEGLTPECFIPWLWAAPWLLMEIASSLGSKRNLVWFGSLTFVLVAALIAWPVLQATRPEYITPTVQGDDGKLAEGLLKYGVFFFMSFLLRKIVLDFLFREKKTADDNDLIYADADVLDPSKARTVKEIMADPPSVNPTFRYGDADQGLIQRFLALMLRMKRRRLLVAACVAAGVLFLPAWVLLYPQPTEQEALQRDIALMYTPSPKRDAHGLAYATPEAVNAAYRVFSYIAEQEESPFIDATDDVLDKWLATDKADPAYLRQMRSGDIVPDPRAIYMADKDDRHLTLSDGSHAVSLVVRHIDGRITSVEMQYAGWNPRFDYKSWRKWRNMRARNKKD